MPTKLPTRMDSRTLRRRCGTILPWRRYCYRQRWRPRQKDELAGRLAGLYKLIIDYQVRSILRFYRSRTKNLWRAVILYDGWEDMVDDIKKCDADFVSKLETVLSANSLRELKKHALEAEPGTKLSRSFAVRCKNWPTSPVASFPPLQDIKQLLADPRRSHASEICGPRTPVTTRRESRI